MVSSWRRNPPPLTVGLASRDHTLLTRRPLPAIHCSTLAGINMIFASFWSNSNLPHSWLISSA